MSTISFKVPLQVIKHIRVHSTRLNNAGEKEGETICVFRAAAALTATGTGHERSKLGFPLAGAETTP